MGATSNKSSSFKRTALTVLLSLSFGAGGFWYYQNNAIAKSESDEPTDTQVVAPSAEPLFVSFEPFTVTFDTSRNSSRVLYLGITLMVQDEVSQARISQFMPVARSTVLTMLGDLDPDSLNERETKDHIRDSVIKAISRPFGTNLHGQVINDVLFTAFVVQ